MERLSLASSSAKSARISIAASSLGAFFACTATLAVAIACWPSAAVKGGHCAPRAAEDAWPWALTRNDPGLLTKSDPPGMRRLQHRVLRRCRRSTLHLQAP
jgi:hypothetical protein